MSAKCPECNAIIDVSEIVSPEEIITCWCCGSELIFKDGDLKVLQFEGEDWGE